MGRVVIFVGDRSVMPCMCGWVGRRQRRPDILTEAKDVNRSAVPFGEIAHTWLEPTLKAEPRRFIAGDLADTSLEQNVAAV